MNQRVTAAAVLVGVVTLFISLLVVVGAAGFALAQPRLPLQTLSRVTAALTIPRQFLLVGVVIWLAVSAARLTHYDKQSGHLAELRLTPLSAGAIVRRYMGLALYEVRFGIALVVGTLPLLHIFTVALTLSRLQSGLLDAVVLASPLLNVVTSIIGLALLLTAALMLGVFFGLQIATELAAVSGAGVIAFFVVLLLSVSNNVLPLVLNRIAVPRTIGLITTAAGFGFWLLFIVASVAFYMLSVRAVRTSV